MGNLGNYQRMVELAKAANGPVRLGIYVVVASLSVGTAIGTFAGPAIKKGATKLVRAARGTTTFPTASMENVYLVNAPGDCGGGLLLRAGDRFRVLNIAEDVILIEVLDDTTNPYVVGRELLESISDFAVTRK